MKKSVRLHIPEDHRKRTGSDTSAGGDDEGGLTNEKWKKNYES